MGCEDLGLLYVFSIPSLGHSLGTGSALAVKSRLQDSTYLEHLSELNLGSAEDIITALTFASPNIFSVGNSLMPPASCFLLFSFSCHVYFVHTVSPLGLT